MCPRLRIVNLKEYEGSPQAMTLTELGAVCTNHVPGAGAICSLEMANQCEAYVTEVVSTAARLVNFL